MNNVYDVHAQQKLVTPHIRDVVANTTKYNPHINRLVKAQHDQPYVWGHWE